MGQLEQTLKQEFQRIAKREANRLVKPLKEENKRIRAKNSELAKEIQSLKKKFKVETAQTRVKEALAKKPPKTGRLSPRLIKSLRKKLGVTQTEFGNLVGASLSSVVNWERGNDPSPKYREKILKLRPLKKSDVKAALRKK